MAQQNIVITGGTRGIGHGMASKFLGAGHRVCITGQTESSVGKALDKLRAQFDESLVTGVACNVSSADDVERAWQTATEAFGSVDMWINNAGMANTMRNFAELDPDDCDPVITTNIIGVMNGCRTAIRGMQQQGHGQVYNMEGFGSDGRFSPGLSVYGTSKRAVTYFTDALITEYADSPVNIGHLSPGIVITDMIMKEAAEMGPERWEKTRRIYNILGDEVDTVTSWLTEHLLADVGKHGSRIAWLTTGKAAGRFFSAFVLRKKRDVVSAYE